MTRFNEHDCAAQGHTPADHKDPADHTCVQGPVCAQQDAATDDGYGYRADHPYEREPGARIAACCYLPEADHVPAECEHESCRAVTHEWCLLCAIETMKAVQTNG